MWKYFLNTFVIFIYGNRHFIIQNSAMFMNNNCLCLRNSNRRALIQAIYPLRTYVPSPWKRGMRCGDFYIEGECVGNRTKCVQSVDAPQAFLFSVTPWYQTSKYEWFYFPLLIFSPIFCSHNCCVLPLSFSCR